MNPSSLHPATFARLAVMMFLQFFVWGSWFVTAPNYLGTIGFGPGDFAWTYSVGPIAAIVSPFFVGMVADRFFDARNVLATMHLLGAAMMLAASMAMSSGLSPAAINLIFFGHTICYYPTLALANTIAMRNIGSAEKQFPLIRVFGTIGWIASNLTLTMLGWDTRIDMFRLSAGTGVLLGLFSLTLPSTPPAQKGPVKIGDVLGLDALVMLRRPSYLVFLIGSMLTCIPLAFYFQITSRVVEMVGLPIGQTMSYGQMSEIFFMLVMPLFFARLGVKWMLALGMFAWLARYLLFAFGAPDQIVWMILVGVVIHGICYDFFFVTGQIYTDKAAPRGIRAQAQGMLVLFTLGIGMLIGAQVAGRVEAANTPPAAEALAAEVKDKGEEIAAIEERMDAGETGLDDQLADLQQEKAELRSAELQSLDWNGLWLFPAGFAGAVLLMFLVFFRDRSVEEAARAAVGRSADGP